MHNTQDKMKRSELQEMIRTAIAEAVNEADISSAEMAAKQAELTAISKKIAALNAKKSDISSGREEIVEDENIDEMANVAVRYELAPEDTGIEGGIDRDLSDEEVDAMFAKVMRGDEEEPEMGDVEKADVSAASMSDEDYEAFMQYTDLENRLAATKSNILKAKKLKGVAGDISDRPSSELENLRALKDRLQTKMDSLLASSEYLQKRQEKATGKKYEPIEAEETETEPLDEWTRGRMQYYAGIKK